MAFLRSTQCFGSGFFEVNTMFWKWVGGGGGGGERERERERVP